MLGFSKRLKHTTLSTNSSLCWSLWQAGCSTFVVNAISLVYRQTEVQDWWVNVYPYTWVFKIYLPLELKPNPGLSTKSKNTAHVCTNGQLLPCSITCSLSPPVLGNYLPLMGLHLLGALRFTYVRAGDLAQWQNACLASSRPWGSSAPKGKKKNKQKRFYANLDISTPALATQ